MDRLIRKGKKSFKAGTVRSNHRTIEAYSAAQAAILWDNPTSPSIHPANHRRSQHPPRSGNDLSSQYTVPGLGGSSPPKNTRKRPGNERPSQHPGARSGNDTASQYTSLSSGSGLGPLIVAHEFLGNDLDLHTSISGLDGSSVVTESSRVFPSPAETGTNSALKHELPLQRPPPDVSTAECPYGILRPILISKTRVGQNYGRLRRQIDLSAYI